MYYFMNIVGFSCTLFIIGFCTLILCSILFMLRKWGNIEVDSLIYQLCTPMKGAGSNMFLSYILRAVLPSAGAVVVGFILLHNLIKIWRYTLPTAFGAAVVYAILTIRTIRKTYLRLHAKEYFSFEEEKQDAPKRDFVKENSVLPDRKEITFPEKKRNLICLYLESMETTVTTPEFGGACRDDYIPELRKLALENVDFSGDTGELNGAVCYPGSTWTMGSIFSSHTGLPLQAAWKNRKLMPDAFFTDICALGDLLEDQGYEQAAIMGADVGFGSKLPFLRDHGNYKIYDYQWAQKNGIVPNDYHVWWGMEDTKMYDMAKKILTELSQNGKPFHAEIITTDTHFPNGYHCERCRDTFSYPYGNVYACASRQVEEFIRWLKEQPFFENTTIAVFGDHPTMDHTFCRRLPENARRNVYTVYINPEKQPVRGKEKRAFSIFDAYPTLLSSIGADVPDGRLGLGTDLFSGRDTLTEELGEEQMTEELRRRSDFIMEAGSH